MGNLTPEQINTAKIRKSNMFLWRVVEIHACENLEKQL